LSVRGVAPAFADTISLQCDLASRPEGNFSGEAVYVLLDLDGHAVVSGYGDSVAHNLEAKSALTVESDRLTWTYSPNGGWVVDYVLDRSTLKLLASVRGVNIGGFTNTGNVTYACSKVNKQI
jgi:hypothetical protein